jgi:hypothetical protein
MAKRQSEETRGRRWTPDEARRVLDDWRASGLSLAAYAQRRGIGYERLGRWKRRLARAEAGAKAGAARSVNALRPVRVVAPAGIGGEDWGFEIRLADGQAVRVAVEFEAEGLRRLLAVLGA